MKLGKTQKGSEKAYIHKEPCIVEMSNIAFGSRGQLFQSYQHSLCAQKFHRYLKERAGIEAVATFAYGNLDMFPQMQLYLWVKDSAVTEQILQSTPYQPCHRDHLLFQSIMDCLLDALRETDIQAFKNVSSLWKMHQTSDAREQNRIYVSITLLSYLRCYMDDLFGATREDVSRALAESFPTYEHFMCGAYSLEVDSLAHKHLYLFMTPEDREKAEKSGDIEKMRRIAYQIVHKRDLLGLVPYDMYMPQIANRRELTSEQLFFIGRE